MTEIWKAKKDCEFKGAKFVEGCEYTWLEISNMIEEVGGNFTNFGLWSRDYFEIIQKNGINFEFKNLRPSTKEWASAYHVDCDIYVGEDFITTYTYNPWWKIKSKFKNESRGWVDRQTTVRFKTGETRSDGKPCTNAVTINECPNTTAMFFGQHWGKRLTDEAAKRIRDEILKGLEGKFPAEIQPERADVIDSLVLDSDALDYSFGDWCDNCGYNSDSISALETYNECCKIGRKLIKMGIWNEIKTECEKLRDEGVL